MEKIKIRFDPTDNTLQVWFADPQTMAYLSPLQEEANGDLHLIKNEAGAVIGFECQFYQIKPGQLTVELETAPLLATLLEHA
ncbi:hypothetical protein BH10CHL1_BH10CHL1_00890 [soil metagenome]